jgi:hypothetical protein
VVVKKFKALSTLNEKMASSLVQEIYRRTTIVGLGLPVVRIVDVEVSYVTALLPLAHSHLIVEQA